MEKQNSGTIREILDHFAKYVEYDPNQKSFNLLSDQFTFHEAGKIMEMLISDYDPSGILAAMYAKKALLKSLKNKQIRLSDLIESMAEPENEQRNPLNDQLQKILSMYQDFHSAVFCSAVSEYIDDTNQLTMQVCGVPMIGERDRKQEEEQFIDSVISVSEDLKKLRLDLYHSSGNPVGKIEKFTTRILVFERMADGILQFEQMPDAMYLCYIRQHDTADGYFAFVIKSNGNLFSINDRVLERYIGQHNASRNGMWTEAHAGNLFPYEFIFSYGEYDYKGYASKYMIDYEKLEFSKLEEKAYRPLLIAMILFRKRYTGKVLEDEPVYLTSLFRENFAEEHPGTELALYQTSTIALWNVGYQCGIDPKKALTSEYNKKFRLYDSGHFWVELYGDGFEPDFSGLLRTMEPKKQLEQWQIDNGQKPPKPKYYPEFVATKDQIDLEIYRKVRIQLADYIQKKMDEESNAWESYDLYKYINSRLQKQKEVFLDMMFRKHFLKQHPEYTADFDATVYEESKKAGDMLSSSSDCKEGIEETLKSHIYITYAENEARTYDAVLNIDQPRISYTPLFDDTTRTKCTIYATLAFENYKEIEAMIGEELPRIFKGWGMHWYNGNSILDVTDAVGELASPLRNRAFQPRMVMGFSRKTFQKMYENWLINNGYEDICIAEKEEQKKEKEEKKKAKQQKELPPAIPFEECDQYSYCLENARKYKNMQQIMAAQKELYRIAKTTATDYSLGKKDGASVVLTLSARIPEKGNADVFKALEASGWTRGWRSKYGRSMYQLMRKPLFGENQ